MLFLDLYGTPCGQARTSSLPKPVQALFQKVLDRKQAAQDGHKLQRHWPDIRDFRAHS